MAVVRGGAIVVTPVNCGGAKLVITTGVDTAASLQYCSSHYGGD